MEDIKLGLTAKDKITGFTGVITGHCEYISGCDQMLLTPKVKEDGTAQDGRWFDKQRIVILEVAQVKLNNTETPGCDMCAPTK